MDPRQICNHLGLQARIKRKVGERRQTPAGTVVSGVNKESDCVFDLAPPRGCELERFINRCNKALEPHKRFLRRISSTGGSAEYFIGMFLDSNHGVVFSPDLLAQLATLQITLSLDLYSGSGKKSRKRKSPRRKQSA
jgi:hypothetical protein